MWKRPQLLFIQIQDPLAVTFNNFTDQSSAAAHYPDAALVKRVSGKCKDEAAEKDSFQIIRGTSTKSESLLEGSVKKVSAMAE